MKKDGSCIQTKRCIVVRILLFLVLVLPVSAYAQKISVSRFESAENDLTANSRGTTVLDQNGDKCALIRVQTTEKGFAFDVGSAGIQKVDDNHVGEIWVYVPFGVRHISIRHQQLGSLNNYNFPISIQKARTYIMEITSDKVFINRYDDTRRQKLRVRVVPADAAFTLNGMNVRLDSGGEAEQDLAFGTYTYRVVADRYYPKEGQVTIDDSLQAQSLVIDDLKPITGLLSVHADPAQAELSVDGQSLPSGTSLKPHALQIGKHRLVVSCQGYRTEEREVEIVQDRTTDVSVKLSQVAEFTFTSRPVGATVSLGGEELSTTPCTRVLKTGTYDVQVRKTGYKDYRKTMLLSSSNPHVHVELSKIYNYRNELYVEAAMRAGSFMAFGGSLGGYIHKFNVEMSFYRGTGDSETVYWNDGTASPATSVYHPATCYSLRFGYGIPLGTRFRITPQVGATRLLLQEDTSDGTERLDGCNVTGAVVAVRCSARFGHFGISLSPEYSYGMFCSDGFDVLQQLSSTIEGWGSGLGVRLGLMLAF